MEKKLVVFDIGNELFGIDIAVVESIVKMQDITKIPRAPDYVEGITNLRGSVIPIIDLRKRLGMTGKQNDRETRIIIANLGEIKTGMIVDAVSEVLSIDDTVIELPPPMITTVNTQFLSGIARQEQRLVVLLNLERILTIDEQRDVLQLVEENA